MLLLLVNLLLAKVINQLLELINSCVFLLDLPLSLFCLAFVHEDLCAALLSLPNRCNGPVLLDCQHALKFARFRFSALSLLVELLLKRLVFTVFVDDGALKPMIFILQTLDFLISIIQTVLLGVD